MGYVDINPCIHSYSVNGGGDRLRIGQLERLQNVAEDGDRNKNNTD